MNAELEYEIPSAFGFERVTVEELVGLWLEHHELVLRSSVATVFLLRGLHRDPPVRVEAAKLIAKVGPLGNWRDLEPCIAAVKAARGVAKDRAAPVEVRRAAAEVLMSGRSWGAGWLEEFSLLRELAAGPVFADFEKLQRYVGEKEETLRRMREARNQKNQ